MSEVNVEDTDEWKNVRRIAPGLALNMVASADFVEFHRKEDKGDEPPVFGIQVKDCPPGLARTIIPISLKDSQGRQVKVVNQGLWTPILGAAVKHLQNRVNDAESEISALQTALAAALARLDALEALPGPGL